METKTRAPAGTTLCPVCGHDQLVAFNHRENAVCARCKAFERTRLGWMIIERLFADRPLRNAVHFAPERGVAPRLHQRLGAGYRAFDFDPSRYPFDFMTVEKLDLCQPLDAVEPGSQDLAYHNHVLEHLPCDPWAALMRIHATLRPGGFHVFSLPVTAEVYAEDFDPKLTGAQRQARFGQDDHMRVFGRLDLQPRLQELFGRDVRFTSTLKFSPQELAAAGIPSSVLTGVNSHVVYVVEA